MLEGKNNRSIYIMMSLIAMFANRAAGCAEQAPFTPVHTAYSSYSCNLMYGNASVVYTSVYRSKIKNHIQRLNLTVNEVFGNMDDEILFKLKFRLLN